MFKQLFASMNDALDEIITQIPTSSGEKRAELEERLAVLKAMSDTCIEEWLLFEEKVGQLSGEPQQAVIPVKQPAAAAVAAVAAVHSPAAEAPSLAKPKDEASFAKGQGYYKLGMFMEAVGQFEQVVKEQPDFLLARVYLAMSYLRNGEYSDAYRHFQFLVPLTDNQKMKAISYNAMGCIQAEQQNMDKALEYFRLAHSADPGSIEPVLNLKQWSKRN
ncbi:MAG: hypothetical protein K0R57_3335 [Paenibacillaceae bacterium]|nr:hypothetical protein [Paenibacillaceae bacterium]